MLPSVVSKWIHRRAIAVVTVAGDVGRGHARPGEIVHRIPRDEVRAADLTVEPSHLAVGERHAERRIAGRRRVRDRVEADAPARCSRHDGREPPHLSMLP